MSASLAAWVEAWRELGAFAADDGLHRRLLHQWSEPHRHYHTLRHLRECLVLFGQAHDQARRPGEVALALWFHDAFYDPQRTDNEARSADWARDSVLQAGLGEPIAKRIHDLVMFTRHDAQVPPDEDAQLLLDVDLAILGADRPRFDEFERQIRAEYAHVPEAAFRERRSRILGGFLARPRLYHTAHFHAALEDRARDNLRHALARLAAG